MPQQLVIALVAVIENAVDFNRPDAVVAVRARGVGNLVRISIEDSGPGMTPHVRSLCQNRGYTTRAGAGGHGVGLFAATRILSEHRGRLVIESERHEGTCVMLEIGKTPGP